jgi:hypothetical protein
MQRVLNEMELLYMQGAVGLVGNVQFDGPSDEYTDLASFADHIRSKLSFNAEYCLLPSQQKVHVLVPTVAIADEFEAAWEKKLDVTYKAVINERDRLTCLARSFVRSGRFTVRGLSFDFSPDPLVRDTFLEDDYACVRELFHPLKEDMTLNITHDDATLHITIVP